MNKIYTQLYTLREETAKDFFGVLDKLAKFGGAGVEFAGYGGISAKEMRSKLDSLGMTGISSHVMLEDLQNNLDAEMEYLHTVGAKYIICPYGVIEDGESAKKYAESFNKIGEKCVKNGFTFGYHNHREEFTVTADGQLPMDILFDNVEPAYMIMQPDLYWIEYMGIDAVGYVLKNVDRCPIIHLKQIENMKSKKSVSADEGIIDFKKLMQAEPNKIYIYEQEVYEEREPNFCIIEEVKKSIEFLR